MDLRRIAARVAKLDPEQEIPRELEKFVDPHDAAVQEVWDGLAKYKKLFEEMKGVRGLPVEVVDYLKRVIRSTDELQDSVRGWNDDFANISGAWKESQKAKPR